MCKTSHSTAVQRDINSNIEDSISKKVDQITRDSDLISRSSIVPFYGGKCVFMTGATGFCGKVLLEKMLRTLHSLDTVYVLLRSKGSLTAQQRLDQLLQHQAFKFHYLQPSQLRKVIAVDGDITKPGLGLSDEQTKMLIERVNIVFHIAASVKFDAEFSFNYNQNTLGTKHVLDLSANFENLEHYVHVSTAYSNSHLQHIPEEIVPIPEDIDILMKQIDEQPELWNQMWTKYAQGRPNTYVFTKAMAEHYVQKHRILQTYSSGTPVRTSIVRPAIVFNSASEPSFGWIDSFNGPAGFSLFIGLGLIRYTDMKLTNVVQLIPVDYLANFLIALPPHVHSQPLPSAEAPPKVYTLTSSPYMKKSLHDMFSAGYKYIEKYPSMYIVRAIRVPGAAQLNPLHFRMLNFFYHQLWSYTLDALLTITGNRDKISMVRLYERYQKACRLMSFFIVNEWHFDTRNYEQVMMAQNEYDTELFPMDMRKMNIDRVCESFVLGARRYLMKESDSTIKQARRKYRWQMIVSHAIDYVFWILIAWFLLRVSSSALTV